MLVLKGGTGAKTSEPHQFGIIVAETFDYIIVGAGSAGCVLADRLTADGRHRVLLLEAGGSDRRFYVQMPLGYGKTFYDKSVNWMYKAEPDPGLNGQSDFYPRGKLLGGSSSINAMVYIRGHRADYEEWEAAGNPGWGWDDVKPWFLHAQHNERGADAFHAQGGPLNVADLQQPNPLSRDFVAAGIQAGYVANPDFNGHSQEGVGLYQVTQKKGERCSSAKAYLTPHLMRRNLQVRTGAQVLRIVLSHTDAGWRATGVEYLRAGVRHTVHARREVLLSAGALLSPQILMLSGIGPAAHLQQVGVSPLHDLPGVGQNLHDHLDAVLVADAPALTRSFGLSVPGVMHIAQGAWEWNYRRTGILTTNFAEAGAFLRSSPQEASPDLQLHFVVGKLLDHGRKTVWGHGFSCHVCVLRPQSRGTVRLRSADPLVAPAIDPNFLADDDDLQRTVRGVQIMRRILAQPALARHQARELPESAAARTPEQIAAWIRQTADTIYHPVGTCRMGTGRMDVVDSQLRVHGVDGLRVVDASIFPRIISGNTNAPTIMVAEKAAHMVLAAAQIQDAGAQAQVLSEAAETPAQVDVNPPQV